jgi:hypothetical protein
VIGIWTLCGEGEIIQVLYNKMNKMVIYGIMIQDGRKIGYDLKNDNKWFYLTLSQLISFLTLGKKIINSA